MTSLDQAPLGRATPYPQRYDPALLFRIARAAQREGLGLRGALPFSGVDDWTAYELSWLDARGKPEVAVARLRVPADSPAIVESKSLKLYLGSLGNERLDSVAAVRAIVERDLSAACGAGVEVATTSIASLADLNIASLEGNSIDGEVFTTDRYHPEPEFLEARDEAVEETLCSSLFRSMCPITGQPDYGDVSIRYAGPRIDHAGLLRYLVSYRDHGAFHETCTEQVFVDILRRCAPLRLSVHMRFTRRGGIDINPFRSNFERIPQRISRAPRQ